MVGAEFNIAIPEGCQNQASKTNCLGLQLNYSVVHLKDVPLYEL